eukprot:m.99688 g.99688  ORF g.99688 m.99688 type:complete len:65 (+) comp37073_c0_seq27:394-588(+)
MPTCLRPLECFSSTDLATGAYKEAGRATAFICLAEDPYKESNASGDSPGFLQLSKGRKCLFGGA